MAEIIHHSMTSLSIVEMYGWIYLLLHVAAVYVLVSDGLVKPMTSLPPDLQGYLDVCRGMGGMTKLPGEQVFWTAMQQYMAKFIKSRPSMTTKQADFFRNTVYDIMVDVFPGTGTRKKRQATTGLAAGLDTQFRGQAQGPRIRKEIRALTLLERRDYFVAVNRLKNDQRLLPNIYDVLADFHTGLNVRRAHFGPSFPGWHRIYLWLYEGFLRLHVPTVTVPYWASVLDEEMTDPTQSVIWGAGFYGNGVGVVTTDPFADWSTINPAVTITRNIGNGQLYTYAGIAAILSKINNSQILIPTAEPDSNFETQHGGPHVFVGGLMNQLNGAAFDPIFFSHHAFVDEIWERFRINQRRRGQNPEEDYPWIEGDPRFNPLHHPTAMMGFFPNNELNIDYQNIVGYSNVFFRLVEYDPVPACPSCANSPYLFCNQALPTPRCVSRTRVEMQGTQYVDDIMTANITGNITRPLPPNITGSITRPLPPVNMTTETCPRDNFINDVKANTLIDYPPRNQAPGSPPNKLAYIPVKIVSKRPPNLQTYTQYSMYDNGLPQPQQLGPKATFVQKGQQGSYSHCDKYNGAAGKVKLVSYGLSYDGSAEDYVLLDNRLGLSESTGYISVKAPIQTDSQVMVAAFDSCGRICKPYCMSGRTSKRMKGGVIVTPATPHQYADSYAAATYNSWTIPDPDAFPIIDDKNVPISFYCDQTDDWFWSDTQGDSYPAISSGPGSPQSRATGIYPWHRAPGGAPSQHPGQRLGHRRTGGHSRNHFNHLIPNHRPNDHWMNEEGTRQRHPVNECAVTRSCTISVPCHGCRHGHFMACHDSQRIAHCIKGVYQLMPVVDY